MTAILALLLLLLPARADWEATLERVVPAVVSIRVNTTRAFDLAKATSAVATGFVVDAERGLILTNRHVVSPAPVVAEAIFQDNEEVPLVPVYRDPVHDFGVFRFDPSAVRFMDVVELPLAPEAARVGLEVRIVGSDAGEKISILSGTLARLDRPAPSYGRMHYNDFNTFYFQAASGTSGGSSGSPVVDEQGRVVALNAGARRRGATSYFLPLDRVVRALEYLRRGEPVPRGTLEAIFRHRTYDEARRLGLRSETEAEARERLPGSTGLLVVDQVIPGGPADGRLEAGDVLLAVDGRWLDGFVPLEAVLDDRVGGSVRFLVERGGERREVELEVADLHAITPSEFVEVGGGVVQPFSYQMARATGRPVRGVVVAGAGLVFSQVPTPALLVSVDGRPVRDLDEAERVLASIPDGARIPVRTVGLENPDEEQVAVAWMDRRWFPMRRCRRDDAAGTWRCADSPAPPPAPAPEPRETTPLPAADPIGRRLAPSLVEVHARVPYRVEGVYGNWFHGVGVLLDAERGWVAVDRDTVPVAATDVRLVFGGSVEVPARPIWLHPVHDLAIVEYDPAWLGGTPVRAAELDPTPLEAGDSVWQVGIATTGEVVTRRTTVERREPVDLPLPLPPTFRATNVETVEPADTAPSMGGVLADRRGRVRALWVSYVELGQGRPEPVLRGMPADIVVEGLEALREGRADPWPVLGVELAAIRLSRARAMGLPDAEARRLEAHDPLRRRAVVVRRRTRGTPAWEALRDGDIVLEAAGEPVTGFRQLERLAWRDEIPMRVLREGRVVEVVLRPARVPALGVTRAVLWAGALLHEPHLAARAQRAMPVDGVYVSWTWYGGPASRYRLRPTRRVTQVDGQRVHTLDDLLAVVSGRPDRSPVRLAVHSLDGRSSVVTLKLDETWWPLEVLERGEDGEWRRRRVAAGDGPG